MIPYDTLTPYEVVDYKGIQYTTCRDYRHISRYRCLRQVIHCPDAIEERFISTESQNPFLANLEVFYYTVPTSEENRLDVIADRFLGSSTYSWVIAYLNEIPNGFSVQAGQRLMIPKSISDLFSTGNFLAPVTAMQLNLGTE